MNQIFVQTNVQSQLVSYGVHGAASTSKQTVKYAIMSTKSTNGALQVPVVKNPIVAIIVQDSRAVGRKSQRILHTLHSPCTGQSNALLARREGRCCRGAAPVFLNE